MCAIDSKNLDASNGDKKVIRSRTPLVERVQEGPTTAAVSGGMGIPEIPAVDFSKFGPVEIKPMVRIKRISGPYLHRAWLNIPHVTHNDEAQEAKRLAQTKNTWACR